MRKNKYYVKMLLIKQDFGGHMNSTFHQRKSFFYIIFVMLTLALMTFGGMCLFSIPKISEVSADVETIEEQNYVEHQSTGVVGTESKSVFFYVSVGKNNTANDNSTFKQELIGNGKTYFVGDDETVVISFARKYEKNNEGEFPKNEKNLPNVDGKDFNTTATVSFATMLTKRDGQDVEGFSNVIQSGTHEYYYKEIQCSQLVEGRYDFSIGYNFDDGMGNITQRQISYSVYLLKNSTYNLEDGTPNVSFSDGISSVYLNTDKVAYERFFNYQYNGDIKGNGFGLATLSYNANHFKVSISHQYEGRIFGYSFTRNGNKLECVKSHADAPDLDYSLMLGIAKITLKDLGTYNISYTYIYSSGEEEVELKTTEFVRGDVLNIFGYQAFYSDYQKDLTEFRGEDQSFAADVTYKRYEMTSDNKLINPYSTAEDKIVDISKIKIVSTNQAPVRFKFNASPISTKYYKWNGTTWKAETDERIIFTDPGIYLVEYKYNFDGYKFMSGDNIVQESTEFSQQFLFELTTTTPVISMEAKEGGQTIYSDTYTKENVIINIKEGTEFDSAIQVVVFKAEFSDNTLFREIRTLSNGGCELSDSGKYKIETKYGKDFKKTNVSFFTIDKDPISGLLAQTVSIADYTDIFVKTKTIDSLFTNMQFALSWNRKASGAVIKCDYQLIPLEKVNATIFSPLRQDSDQIWISSGTNLKWVLADINNFVPYTNTLGKTSVSGSEILNEAGLYLFKLKDEAGHEAEFYVFLDNSETKFLQKRSAEEGGEYFEPTALNNVASDTTVVWGTHKTISISGITSANVESDSIGRLKNFFASYLGTDYISSMGSSIIFKNKIQEVLMYTDLDGAQRVTGTEYVVKVLKDGLPNEQIYNFYSVDSANQKIAVGAAFSEYDTSVYSGRHTIKVSTDMSKSIMITSSDLTFGSDGKPQLEELQQYGSSVIMPTDLNNPVDVNPSNLEDYLKLKNLKNFYFTNKDVIYFALIKEIDEDIKVKEVNCDFYALTYNAERKTNEYSSTATKIEINLELWTAYNNYLASIGDSSIYYIGAINIGESEMTRAGKYVVSRIYDETAGASTLSQKYDYLTREFVFFVDRNPVLTGPSTYGETLAKEVGEYIKMYVLAGNQNQVLFDAFYRQPQVANKNDLSSISDILKTNKLPVRIYIPFAKYGYQNADGVFTIDSLNAKIITSYSEDGIVQVLHPNMNLRVKITFKNGNTLRTTEYNSLSAINGYLGISDITESLGSVVGEYFVDIYDGMGNSWLYKFVINNNAPSMDFVALTNGGQTKSAIYEGAKYTNADELRVEWSDPQSEYLAKIDKGETVDGTEKSAISYTINGAKYEVLPSDIKSEGSKYYFVISSKIVGGETTKLADGDEIVVSAHFEGNAADYPNGSYYFERKITIDYIAPVVNLNKMIDGVLIKDSSEMALTRDAGDKYNKTQRTGDSAYISYAIASDFKFEFSNFTSETANIYYRRFDNKYSQEVKEINLPTDPNANGSNMFNVNDFISLRNPNSFPKTTGLYEIVEIDSAGNYTVYTVYLYSSPKEVLTVSYDSGTSQNETETFEDVEAEIGVFNSFTLKDLDINGDHWYNIYVKKDGETTSSVFRHTPNLADGEVYIGGSSQKTTLRDAIKFDNNSKYTIDITSRQKRALKTLTVKITTMSRRFDVSFVETDGGAEINIARDDILEIKGNPVVEVGTLQGANYVYEQVEYNQTTLDNLTRIAVAYDTTKLLRLSLPTNFSTTQYFFYIHGQKQIEEEVTGDDLITTDVEFDYVSSHDVSFTYNNLLYNVVVGYGAQSYVNEYVENVDGSLTTLTLKAAPFTYSRGGKYVGENRTFTLTIRSLINSAGSEQESDRIIKVNINNILPQINLYNDYGEEQNVLFSGGITRQDVIVKFDAENIEYVVTICKKGEAVKNEIASGYKASDYGTYEITCSLADGRTASYTKYFTITQTELSVYAVITKNNEADENFEFLESAKNYYEFNGRTLPYYITNKPYVAIKTDSSLDINSSFTTIYSREGVVTRLYTISNTHAGNQNIYVNDQIVITIVPQTNKILTNFYKVNSTGADVKIQDLVSDKEIMTSVNKGTGAIENVRGNEQVTLRWDSYHLEPNNKILVTYKFEDQLIFEKREISSLVLSSSGKHTLIFEDMAGNINIFTQNIQQSNSFDFYFIRSVVFKINDKNPIDYAVYNGETKISIPDESLKFYDASSSPQIIVKRAGEEIEVSGRNRVWTVSEPGFYEVSFLAKWLGEYILVEPIHFSIINPTESRLAYEFMGVEKYEITSVLKGDEEIISRLGGKGIRSLSATLGDEKTGEGRYTVTVRAVRDDSNLPVLDFTFKFWLHQANPPIVVSVEQGTETKDVITVQFNVYNLYDEVGDCYVKIGNMDPIAVEGENLATMDELQKIDIKSRGDYFIQVYTKSGNLVYSYRVIKKDPLNTVTIVLICVGVAVLIALTIVFVKLRKRVKIR